MITVSLVEILIMNVSLTELIENNCNNVYCNWKDPLSTPWTNPSIVGVPGWYSFNNLTTNPRAIMAIESANAFASVLNNKNLSFDYAIAMVK